MRKNNVSILTVLFIIILSSANCQIIIPSSIKQLEDYERESKIRAFLGIDLSVTKANEIIDNQLTGQRIDVSRTYYNEAGLAERIIHFDSAGNYSSFSIIKYFENNLPMERIKFSPDSIIIEGTSYKYNDDNLIVEITNYTFPAIVTTQNRYFYENDKTITKRYNRENELLYKNELTFFGNPSEGLIKTSIKSDIDGHVFETIQYTYNENNRLAEKHLVSDFRGKSRTKFEYNAEGALVKTTINDLLNRKKIITIMQYDDFGNLIKIIDKNEHGEKTNYLTIEYFVASS